MIVPFQSLIMISSPSSNPYEQLPSPIPFSPFSSSSSRRKFRGTGRQIRQRSKSDQIHQKILVRYLWPSYRDSWIEKGEERVRRRRKRRQCVRLCHVLASAEDRRPVISDWKRLSSFNNHHDYARTLVRHGSTYAV
jgi:hypothetical protein